MIFFLYYFLVSINRCPPPHPPRSVSLSLPLFSAPGTHHSLLLLLRLPHIREATTTTTMMAMNATASRAAARPARRAMTSPPTTTTSASLSSATRCSTSTAAFGRALPSHRLASKSTAFLSAARRPSRSAASARSSGLAARAVLDVDESTFEEEVLKVRN